MTYRIVARIEWVGMRAETIGEAARIARAYLVLATKKGSPPVDVRITAVEEAP